MPFSRPVANSLLVPLPFWPRGERPTSRIAVSTLVPSRVELALGLSDLGGDSGVARDENFKWESRLIFTPTSPGVTPKISPSEKRPYE